MLSLPPSGGGGGAHFISFQFILNLLIPCWFCRVEGCLRGGGEYLRYRHLFLHLLTMCEQKCMEDEGGGDGGQRNQEGGKGEEE